MAGMKVPALQEDTLEKIARGAVILLSVLMGLLNFDLLVCFNIRKISQRVS